MRPTMQLRLHSTLNEVTVDMIHVERARTDESLMACKKRLENRQGPVLQQFHQHEEGDRPQGLRLGECEGVGGRWIPVQQTADVVSLPLLTRTLKP